MRKDVNFRLIFLLSLGGLVLAIGSLFALSGTMEQIAWALLFLAYGYPVLKFGRDHFFYYGLYTGFANMVWMMLVHIIWLPVYLAHHVGRGVFFVSLAKSPYPRLVVALMDLLKYSFTALAAAFFTYVISNAIKKAFEG